MTDRPKFSRRLLAIVFPDRCAACDEVIYCGDGVCEECRAQLPRVGIPVCPFCGLERAFCRCRKQRRHFDRVVAPFYYDGVVEKAILRMKALGSRVFASFFANDMAETVRQHYSDIRFDSVVFVPSEKRRLRQRGYNPGRIVAEETAARLGLPLLPALVKLTDNAPQKSLPAMERSGNVLGVFDLAEGVDVSGKTLLLVDDIVTTGATLDECAKMLKIYGTDAVYAVVAATTRPHEEDADA